MVSSANGSQMDTAQVIKGLTKAAGTLLFYRSTGSFPVEGDPIDSSVAISPFHGTDLSLLRLVRPRLLFPDARRLEHPSHWKNTLP